MNLDYPPEAEAFRTEFRAWLEDNLDPDLESARGVMSVWESPEGLDRRRRWNRTRADAGYAAIAWPAQFGGRGAGLIEQVVYAEELHRAGAPGTLNPIGISNIAPAILQHGTEDQKRRFLPPMLRGDEIWCQGFSEPNAGSDLASLSTRAVADGDDFVVNGQKVWTSLAHRAHWCILLCRTDPTARKHLGISYLLVDMRSPGITVRPLVQITGDAEFN